jgi:DNA-binding NarL/FixJ family response regulator
MIVHRETILQTTVHDTVIAAHQRGVLSPTEGRVFALMGLLSNKQIAHKLGISDQTVKNHVTRILEKLGAGDRTHAVVIGIGTGLLRVSVEYTKTERS